MIDNGVTSSKIELPGFNFEANWHSIKIDNIKS